MKWPAGGRVFEGSRESCERHGLPHDVLTSAELTRRFPGYRLPEETMAVFQPEGGFLLPERCVVSHVTAAQALGAEVHGRERVLRWSADGAGVRVKTDRDEYSADRLVVTAGQWAATLLDGLGALAVPERQVHFIVDRYPGSPNVILAAGFSGHGFKFCSVVGEILADLAHDGSTAHDISLFEIGRFGGVGSRSTAPPPRVDR